MLSLNTDLLLNCLDGLEENTVQQRGPGQSNSIAFLAAHLTDTRHYLATYLGHPASNPLEQLLAGARSIEDLPALPRADTLRQDWLEIGEHLDSVLGSIDPALLSAQTPQRFPVNDSTRLGGLVFLMQHESYHIGQMAQLRRQLGHPAMTYRRRG